jgi:hypothetical protein
MWTQENQARHDRSKLRDPSDPTGAEWALTRLLIPPAKPGRNKRTANDRTVSSAAGHNLLREAPETCSRCPFDLSPQRAERPWPCALPRLGELCM